MSGVRAFASFAGARGEHRITLERFLAPGADDCSPYALWIGMNPSGADADVDDLTVHKEQVWTRDYLGLPRYVKMNWGTYRATQPADLSKPGVVVCLEEENRAAMLSLAAEATKVVLTCGNPPDPLLATARRLLSALLEAGIALSSLGTPTKAGWPKHSSRLAYATEFKPFLVMPA